MITIAVWTKTSIKFSELNNKFCFTETVVGVQGFALDSSYFVKPEIEPLTSFL